MNWIQGDIGCPEPELINIISICVSCPIESAIISEDTFEKLVILTETLLHGVCKDMLCITNRTAHKVQAKGLTLTVFLLRTLDKISKLVKQRKNIDQLFKVVYFDVLQLTTCSPIDVAVILEWDEPLHDPIDLFSEVKTLAKSCSDLIGKYFTEHDDSGVVKDAVDSWVNQWGVAFFDNNHCASVADHRVHLVKIISFLRSSDVRNDFWSRILKGQKFWASCYTSFISSPNSWMIVQDSLFDWHALVKGVKIPQDVIKFDHDGISDYGRIALLSLGLLQEPIFSSHIPNFSWLFYELERFRLALNDSKSPFENGSVLKDKDVSYEINHTLDLLLTSTRVFSDLFDPSENCLMKSILELFDGQVTLSTLFDIRVFYKVIERFKGIDKDSSQILLEKLLQINQINESLFLKSCIFLCFSSDEPISGDIIDEYIEETLEQVLDLEKADFKKNFEKGFRDISNQIVYPLLTFLSHTLKSSEYLFSTSLRGRTLRKIRSWYDAVVSEGFEESRSDNFKMLDIQVACCLKFVLQSVLETGDDIGIGMSTFIIQLVYHWLKGLVSSTSLLTYDSVHLHYVLLLVDCCLHK